MADNLCAACFPANMEALIYRLNNGKKDAMTWSRVTPKCRHTHFAVGDNGRYVMFWVRYQGRY